MCYLENRTPSRESNRANYHRMHVDFIMAQLTTHGTIMHRDSAI